MQIIASGQAGLFAIRTAAGYTVERLDTGEIHEASSRDVSYYFSGCNDLAQLTVSDIAEARAVAEAAWAADRAVRLFVMLLDPTETEEDLAEVGGALEELLEEHPGIDDRVERQTFSAPLAHPIDVARLRRALESSDLTKAMLDRFLSLQPFIARVRGAFDMIEEDAFGEPQARSTFLEEAIAGGSMRSLVLAAASGQGVDPALFKLYSDLRELDNNREIIKRWTSSFERIQHDLVPLPETESTRHVRVPLPLVDGRQAFENAMQQQGAIVERIRDGDFDTARRFARELIASQRRTSTTEHIAKSLTNLSQQAKRLEVLDLALEWALAAVEVKGDDPMTHAQLADLLMRVGRYTEAARSLDLAQSFGYAGFAASGRARILRYQGAYEQALAAYRQALSKEAYDENDAQHDHAGIAECLRDMERLGEALDAYNEALEKFPYSAVLLSGKAATLVDLGDFNEAGLCYQAALDLSEDPLVPRVGIASLHRRAGDFETAERQYRSILHVYPFSIHARGGLVSTLRELGRHDEAVDAARDLLRYLPGSADALWTLADALIDAQCFDEATATLHQAIEDHRHVAGLRAGLARVAKAQGHYATALALYDDAARDFPSNAWLQVNRADMLRRLGNVDEALRIYERALEKHPHRLGLRNAVASIYIHQHRFEEAHRFLVIDDPRSSDEWRNFALRALLESAEGNETEARERFEWGIERCQFRRERQMLRAGLARLLLKADAIEAAIETTRECTDDVTELVRFHACAVQEDKGPAVALYERLKTSFLPEPWHELRDEIARQNNVINFPAKRDRLWVISREMDALLLEAA